MKNSSVISRLRAGDPVPTQPETFNSELFQRIVSLPGGVGMKEKIPPRIAKRRIVFITAGALVAAAVAAVAIALFPESSPTSTGLSKFSTQGTPVSFDGTQPHGLGTPYVLMQLDGRAYFRVEQVKPTELDKTFGNE